MQLDDVDGVDGVDSTHTPGVIATPLGHLYEFYLSGPIQSPEHYLTWFHVIRNAQPNDIIKIHINSHGGDAATALQFMRVMAESEALIIASVEGECISAATMIFLSADQVEISPHSLFMFHNYSGGVAGKGGEMFEQISFLQKWSEALMRDIYKDFLTEAEINSILANKDIWMDAESVSKRIKQKFKATEKQVKTTKKEPKLKIPSETN